MTWLGDYFSLKTISSLVEASGNGDLETVRDFISRRYEIEDGDEALSWVCYKGQLKVVKYLVSIGADIHYEGDDPLCSASEAGHLKIFKYLVSLGGNIHTDDDYPFRTACAKGHLDLVNLLSDK